MLHPWLWLIVLKEHPVFRHKSCPFIYKLQSKGVCLFLGGGGDHWYNVFFSLIWAWSTEDSAYICWMNKWGKIIKWAVSKWGISRSVFAFLPLLELSWFLHLCDPQAWLQCMAIPLNTLCLFLSPGLFLSPEQWPMSSGLLGVNNKHSLSCLG